MVRLDRDIMNPTPVTFAPRWVLLAWIVGGLVVAGWAGLALLSIGLHWPAWFIASNVVGGILSLAWLVRVARVGVEVGDEAIIVRNPFRSQAIPLADMPCLGS